MSIEQLDDLIRYARSSGGVVTQLGPQEYMVDYGESMAVRISSATPRTPWVGQVLVFGMTLAEIGPRRSLVEVLSAALQRKVLVSDLFYARRNGIRPASEVE